MRRLEGSGLRVRTCNDIFLYSGSAGLCMQWMRSVLAKRDPPYRRNTVLWGQEGARSGFVPEAHCVRLVNSQRENPGTERSTMQRKKLALNLFGEPCAGKTAAAHYITGCLKMLGIHAEYTGEYAKDCAWEHRSLTVADQIYIFAKQYHRMWVLAQSDETEVIVTDSPLLLSIHYNRDPTVQVPLDDLVQACWAQFDNRCYWLERSGFEFQADGRFQASSAEAAEVGAGIIATAAKYGIRMQTISSQRSMLDTVAEQIAEEVLEARASADP